MRFWGGGHSVTLFGFTGLECSGDQCLGITVLTHLQNCLKCHKENISAVQPSEACATKSAGTQLGGTLQG